MIQSAPTPVSRDMWDPRFDHWATQTQPPLSRDLVHKSRDENVLVSRVEPLNDTPDDHRYAVRLHFDPDHAFFFEHPVDHVPGLALIEAGRQVGLAVAHLFFDVPTVGVSFFLNALEVDFTSFAAIDRPVFGLAEMRNVTYRRDRIHTMDFTGHMLQQGRLVSTLRGTWTLVPTAVMHRVRQRT